MAEYVPNERLVEARERIAELEAAISEHREAHRVPDADIYMVSHVADLPLWTVLKNDKPHVYRNDRRLPPPDGRNP